MPAFRVYEVQNEVIARKWMYEVEALSEDDAMNLIREGDIEPIDCGTLGEPFYAESGFVVQTQDADRDIGWENAAAKLNSIERSH